MELTKIQMHTWMLTYYYQMNIDYDQIRNVGNPGKTLEYHKTVYSLRIQTPPIDINDNH